MTKIVLPALGAAMLGLASLSFAAPAFAGSDCSCTARHARIGATYELLQIEKARKAAEEAVQAEVAAPKGNEAETPTETVIAAPTETDSGG